MSLTSMLDDPDSAVRQLFSRRLPHTAALLATVPNRMTLSVPLTPLPSERERYPWGTVGTAFDYLLRYRIRNTPATELVADSGARLLAPRGQEYPASFLRLAAHLHGLLGVGEQAYSRDVWRRELARACHSLALFEQCYRAGPNPEWPLLQAGPDASLETLLALCPDDVCTDLLALYDLTTTAAGRLFTDPDAVLNPVFAGSALIGGADADLIAHRTLIEMKVTTDGRRKWAPTVRQLVGYLLLDFHDEHALAHIGIYFARQGQLHTWPIEKALTILAGGPVALADLRAEMHAALEQTQAEWEQRRAHYLAQLTATLAESGRTLDDLWFLDAEPEPEEVSGWRMPIHPPASGKGCWHPSKFDIGSPVSPDHDVHTTPACGARVVLDVTEASAEHAVVGTSFPDAPAHWCRTCLPYSTADSWQYMKDEQRRRERDPALVHRVLPFRSAPAGTGKWHIAGVDLRAGHMGPTDERRAVCNTLGVILDLTAEPRFTPELHQRLDAVPAAACRGCLPFLQSEPS